MCCLAAPSNQRKPSLGLKYLYKLCPLFLWAHVAHRQLLSYLYYTAFGATSDIFTKVVQTVLQNDLNQHLCLNSSDWKKEKNLYWIQLQAYNKQTLEHMCHTHLEILTHTFSIKLDTYTRGLGPHVKQVFDWLWSQNLFFFIQNSNLLREAQKSKI